MALAQAFRFIIYNEDTGVSLDFSSNSANESADVIFERYHIDTSNGDLNRNTTNDPTTDSASSDIANGGTEVLADHTGNTDIGLHGTFKVTTDNASASGSVRLLMEISPDNGTTWPSDAANFDPDKDADLVASLDLSGAETVRVPFEV